jgi:hypothetical protein
MDKVPSAKGAIYISLGQRPRTMDRKATRAEGPFHNLWAGLSALGRCHVSVPGALPRLVWIGPSGLHFQTYG